MKANTEDNTGRYTKWAEASGRPVARSRAVQPCAAACLQLPLLPRRCFSSQLPPEAPSSR